MFHREFSSPDAPASELRVAQFNMLADGLSAKRPDGGGFSDVPREHLDWEYRRPLILAELERARPHVIGMQEADRHRDIAAHFEPLGYASVFVAKLRSPCLEHSDEADGCLVLYDTARFRLLAEASFSVGSNQVAACAVVESQDTQETYVLCATHLKAGRNEHSEARRTEQMRTLRAELTALEHKYAATSTFVMLDMNGTPSGTAYAESARGFTSAMLEASGSEPAFTTQKKRGDAAAVSDTIDYILYRSSRLRPSRFLRLPAADALGNLPNARYPSDHVMLCVGFTQM